MPNVWANFPAAHFHADYWHSHFWHCCLRASVVVGPIAITFSSASLLRIAGAETLLVSSFPVLDITNFARAAEDPEFVSHVVIHGYEATTGRILSVNNEWDA